MVKYIGFYVYHRSYQLWSPVIVNLFMQEKVLTSMHSVRLEPTKLIIYERSDFRITRNELRFFPTKAVCT